jgi:hypothetical protein
MKKLNHLSLLLIAILAFACSKEDENPKLVEKDVTIEVTMEGDYSEYLASFTVHSMLAGTSTFVAPVLNQPSDLDWTQVVAEGNTYTLSFKPDSPEILATSSAPIHSLGFVFNAIHMGGDTDNSSEPLSATVRVLADDEIYQTYSYTASASVESSVPLTEEISFK